MSGVEGDQAGRVSMVSSRYRARKRELTNQFLRISEGKNRISKKLQAERYGIREFVSDTISGAGGANPPRRLVLVPELIINVHFACEAAVYHVRGRP